MKLKSALLGAALAVASSSAFAQAISVDQWYSAAFGTSWPSPVFGPGYVTGYNGPLPGGGTGNSIFAPSGSSWTVTLSSPGYIVFTDLEGAGDQFQVFINGSAATLASNTLTPSGQSGLAGGYTSNPGSYTYVGEDIGAALGNSAFSSGTFFLPSGTDTISATFIGSLGYGDVAFLAHGTVSPPIPEVSTWVMMLAGFAGLGLVGYRRHKTAAVAAS